MDKILGIIPARAGSKRIPGKTCACLMESLWLQYALEKF